MLYWFCTALFWGGIGCVLHTYLLYPWWLRLAARGKSAHGLVYGSVAETGLPWVSVLIAAYNEERVLEAKLESVLASGYPLERIRVYIGSDCSNDRTNEIGQAFAQRFPAQVWFFPFTARRGKPSIINELAAFAQQQLEGIQPLDAPHLLLITDANVFFTRDTVFQLARHFRDPAIALVDSHIQNPPNPQADEGVAGSESRYLSREIWLKHLEGRAWGAMIGPLGGCYAVRADYFAPIPPNSLVDDFYVCMQALERGGLAINELDAICYEHNPNELGIEYRRKTRIAAGNLANLARFRRLLWPPHRPLAFAFWSHKVLRWFTPFFGILAYMTNLILCFLDTTFFYPTLFLLLNLTLFGIPLADAVLRRLGINLRYVRLLAYFIWMNVALLHGAWNYLRQGATSGIWQPTKRG